MSTVLVLILLFLALALIISAGLVVPQRNPEEPVEEPEVNADGQVESELLRRPLRSRHPV
jgi:hypothetical protein